MIATAKDALAEYVTPCCSWTNTFRGRDKYVHGQNLSRLDYVRLQLVVSALILRFQHDVPEKEQSFPQALSSLDNSEVPEDDGNDYGLDEHDEL
jgi:hypothetical protein